MTEKEMTGLLLKLADIGITGIKVHYDGGGDSGAIEHISYTKEPCETPDDVDEHAESWSPDCIVADVISTGDYTLIEDFAYKLLNDVEDWWNNEGGYGDMSICVPSGQYIIDNHVRYYSTEDYQHEGNLIEKSLE
jgi:hypothetical protein